MKMTNNRWLLLVAVAWLGLIGVIAALPIGWGAGLFVMLIATAATFAGLSLVG